MGIWLELWHLRVSEDFPFSVQKLKGCAFALNLVSPHVKVPVLNRIHPALHRVYQKSENLFKC